MKKLLVAGALIVAAIFPLGAWWNYGGDLADTAITYSKDFDGVPVDDARVVSVQAIWSSATIPTCNFNDGAKSTGSFTISTTAFTGARVNINGVSIIQGVHWATSTTVGLMAKSLSDAIMANSNLNTIVVSTWNAAGVVSATATAVGVNAYELITTTPAAVAKSADAMAGGAASAISSANDTITSTKHGLALGSAVLYNTLTGTAPGGLTNAVTYYAIVPDIDTIKLAATSTGAVAGLAIDLGTQTGSGTFRLTPVGFAGTPSFKLQVSNDNSNWFDLNVASITYSGASNYLWDLGQPSYRYIRVKYTHGTSGALNLNVKAIGR